MKEMVNVLFVCGYGVGSSAIAESILKKALVDLKVSAEVQHTAVGEMNSLKDWTDILVISTKLAEGIDFKDTDDVIQVVNVMDGKGIAAQILEIVNVKYPEAVQK